MAGFVEALGKRKVFVEFPQACVDDWLPACEVLVQERVRAWSFPVDRLELLPDALRLFGRRARIGVHGVRSAEEASRANELGVHFLTSPYAAPEVIEAAGSTPMAVGAITPTEVARALELGASTILVTPIEMVDITVVGQYRSWFAEATLIPMGRLAPIVAEQHVLAGAPVIGLAGASLFSDDGQRFGDDLDAVRRRCQAFNALL